MGAIRCGSPGVISLGIDQAGPHGLHIRERFGIGGLDCGVTFRQDRHQCAAVVLLGFLRDLRALRDVAGSSAELGLMVEAPNMFNDLVLKFLASVTGEVASTGKRVFAVTVESVSRHDRPEPAITVVLPTLISLRTSARPSTT